MGSWHPVWFYFSAWHVVGPYQNDPGEMMVQFLPLPASLGKMEIQQTLMQHVASSQVKEDAFLYLSTIKSVLQLRLCFAPVVIRSAPSWG